ncbi:MAG TPA: hypothetical protein VH250_06420 [Granulicella sp.]|nr:hypothetical protein [Granulicella sp.]
MRWHIRTFVLDLFTLDVLTEFLTTPLAFISYLDRRTRYDDEVTAGHELTIFSYHLKQNLWMSGEFDRMMLTDDISADLDAVMSVRREGTSGARTPIGILTVHEGKSFDAVLKQLERRSSDAMEFGLFLLTMSGDSASQFSLCQGVDAVCALAQEDARVHDFSMMSGPSGVTVHVSNLSVEEAMQQIRRHVKRRKYREKASRWFGLVLNPATKKIRYIVGNFSEIRCIIPKGTAAVLAHS